MNPPSRRYHLVQFDEIPEVSCPCGTSRRAFADVAELPGTVHRTEISAEAKLHYHHRLSETYYVLRCEEGAQIQLDDDLLPVRPGTCVFIPPGVRHRALGKMTVLIIVFPKFDPEDEVVIVEE